MKPPRFAYHDPSSIDETLDLLAHHGDGARILAGGQSLMPMLNFRLARPDHLVDINRVAELTLLQPGADGGLRIGALVRQRTLERAPLIRERCPLIAQAMPFIGHPQIRSRGTIGGSLAHADPSADYPAVMLALDASFQLVGPKGRREVKAVDFFKDLMTVDLAADEILASVHFTPVRTAAYAKLVQRASHYAIVGVAAALEVKGGSIASARVGLTGGSSHARRLTNVEQALAGQTASKDTIEAAARLAGSGVDYVNSDLHASEEYRRAMIDVFARRALTAALARA